MTYNAVLVQENWEKDGKYWREKLTVKMYHATMHWRIDYLTNCHTAMPIFFNSVRFPDSPHTPHHQAFFRWSFML